MSKLFRREKQLMIGDKLFPDLDMDFNITFNEDDVAPINDVTIYNVKPDTIAYIQKNMELKLNAGYSGNLGNVLMGTIADFSNKTNGTNTELKVLVNTDANVVFNRILSKTYAPGTTAMQILTDLFRMITIEVGTIKVTNNIVYPDGKIISGTMKKILYYLVAETNSFMFVRNNIIYIVDSAYEVDTGYLLRSDTGLIGSPEAIDIDGERGYKFVCLLNPMLTTGSVFRAESKQVNGLFRVIDGTHSGSSFETVVNCLPTNEVSRYVKPVKYIYATSIIGNTDKLRIWNFLKAQGFSDAATSGVMGNFEQESGYSPDANESGEAGPYGYGGYGIAQWTGGRRETLFSRADGAGVPVNDLQFQLEHFMWEITVGPENNSFSVYGGLSGGLNEFKSLSDPADACIVFEASLERAGTPMMDNRIRYAHADFAELGGKTTEAGGSSSSSGDDGNFPAGAFKCECGCGRDVVPELKAKMNQVWDAVGEIIITSGFRCEFQNNKDGGVPNSFHLSGQACDGYVPGGSVDYLADAEQNAGLGTLRYYSSGFCHGQLEMTDVVMD